jgi:hypothetical protein
MTFDPVEIPLKPSPAVKAAHEHPRGRLGSVVVFAGVVFDGKDDKIAETVVVLDVVEVVDMLARPEFASQRMFHNKSVLKFIRSANADSNVAVRALEFAAPPVSVRSTGASPGWIRASARAIGPLPALDSTGINFEIRTA